MGRKGFVRKLTKTTIRTDWDGTSFLTQLGAGDGPVIIDTTLTGFEKLESLWQPLDGFLEQSGLVREILPAALNFWKIGEVTFGIARDFQIETLVVPNDEPVNWDYKGYLGEVEKLGASPIVHWYGESVADRRQ